MAAIAAALIALAVGPGTAAPQIPGGNVVVDTTKDGNDGECARDCTVREALAVADINTGRWVQIPPGFYRLTLGPLVIGNDVMFGVGFGANQSAGARTTVIDARGASRVIQVAANSTAVVAGLTIKGGGGVTAGGGALIPSGSQLSLYDAIVDENAATQRGGGIDNQGNLSLFHTTVSDNQAGSGGGVAIEPSSNAAIYFSTLSGNRASANGGGITTGGSLQLQNDTIAGNTAAAGGGLFQESTDTANTAMWSTLLGVNTGGACGGSINGIPRSITSSNLAADATCLFTGTQGTNSADPQLGTLRNNGGPTDTRAILSQSSPAVNNGDTQLCPSGGSTDQRYAPAVGACDIGAFEFGGKPPQPQLPPPVAGETVNVFRARGTVKIKLPGSDEFFLLQQGQQVPVGSTFDTNKGRVTLRAAGKAKAWFYQGVFKLGQTKGKKPLSTLTLTGKLQCGGSGKASAAAKKKKKRRLWGDGKGKFRTKGKHSAATVVGTKWLVEDRCNGTLTKVKRGVVKVRDFKKRKTITVRAPRSYFAKR